MHFMKKYIRKFGKLFSLSVFLVTVEALCDLLQPTIMARIIDTGVAANRMDVVLRLGGLMLLVTAFGAAAAAARNIVSSRVSQQFGTELRSDLFTKIQSLSFENIDSFERASLVTRLTNDVTQVQFFSLGLMRIFVKAPLLCIGSFIMAVRLNPHLALVLAIVVPIVALLIFINMKVGFPRFMKLQQMLDRINGATREYLSGVRVVKAFNRYDYETEKFDKANMEYQGHSIKVMRVMSFFNPAIMLAVNFGIVGVIWLGGLGVSEGRTPVGHIIAFINYMTQILFALMVISWVMTLFVRAKASTTRIGEVFAQNSTMEWKEDAQFHPGTKGRIDFEGVSFSYKGSSGTPVIRQVTFSCLPGQTVGIIGSTGSGKSSLVGLIPRYYDADSGVIRVDGVDVRDVDPRKLREKIAVVPQKTVLFTGTILENIRWGKDGAAEEEVREAAQIAQADGFISGLPEGYLSELGQRGVNLSGGQKQRIAIARALVRKPEILILDDCTSALDVDTEARIKQGLKAYAADLTCILIAQRVISVMDTDQIVVLDHGEVAGIGDHDTLLQDCRVYREIYQSQVGKELQPNVEVN
ncbi:ABC transporter [Cohnella kolymensis]|uniref:ABC transporter n=1 Tax=Cohnella kolymensis TaxID=1590652 RepID=A0ABR5AA96_9BACL|nr:ABC transporter ATP-binding protein [Cohnella kolymensis]KIL37332.1 ABC transporter [Cohnella kolymensis]